MSDRIDVQRELYAVAQRYEGGSPSGLMVQAGDMLGCAETEIVRLRTRAETAEAERDAMRAVVEAAADWIAKRGRDAGLFHIAEGRLDCAVAALATKEG